MRWDQIRKNKSKFECQYAGQVNKSLGGKGEYCVTYHRKTLEMLGREPVQTELPSGLPRSVAEWYSLDDAVSLLEKYSNQDRPLRPSDFEVISENGQIFTVFMYENQGVCWWAYSGDGADPPVYVNLDPPPNQWFMHSETFSIFVYTRVFDFWRWYNPQLHISGNGGPLSSETLQSLRDSFEEHPITWGWPGNTQYRFSRGDQRIVIWDTPTQAYWHFSADSAGSLVDLFRQFSSRLLWHTDPPDVR
jgi:hypothetical protein